ncbi:fused PTS fructose transporter subunit IIA/HPr protein [Vibrio sp. ZSDE26]|uniref:Multiphosphoryl transfer protein n=1 Tax=Vibrio amylolyticus TaxID=2847292 RepID=A0A9X2BFK2_9VIBR|nr:fused PTS fructose transporter subunit IIA/HPr protein [Vibrio amylolyticus]MCK6261906.1 fused PTS fructose transporter subunit IIA/HPr protein [Vibrio amylolyticus]
MLTLTTNDITLNQSFSDKTEAIRSIASDLSAKGYVKGGYVEGMLAREAQNSTYLGNGIAIPHGTTQTRDLVSKTGVTLYHFPEGINWGDENTVYVAIGIAAQSDEHLGILKQLTNVLSGDDVEEQLRQAKTEEQLIAILNGEAQSKLSISPAHIQLQFPATDMIQMNAVASGLLRNQDCVEPEFISNVINKTPTHLGSGVWLVSSESAVKQTAISVVTTSQPFNMDNTPVNALIAVSACNQLHQSALETLTELVFNKQLATLLSKSEEQLVALFSNNGSKETQSSAVIGSDSKDSDSGLISRGEFKIKNAHGLHARPGAMLVAEAKKFESTIQVSNLDSDSAPVNAKSLMKVISLGVKHGYTLKFTADGQDSKQAIESIGKAIESGLGEG